MEFLEDRMEILDEVTCNLCLDYFDKVLVDNYVLHKHNSQCQSVTLCMDCHCEKIFRAYLEKVVIINEHTDDRLTSEKYMTPTNVFESVKSCCWECLICKETYCLKYTPAQEEVIKKNLEKFVNTFLGNRSVAFIGQKLEEVTDQYVYLDERYQIISKEYKSTKINNDILRNNENTHKIYAEHLMTVIRSQTSLITDFLDKNSSKDSQK